MGIGAFDITYGVDLVRRPGIRVFVVDGNGVRIMGYPFILHDENDAPIGLVQNEHELITMWNSTPVCQAVGKLELNVEGTEFWLILKGNSRGFIRGNAGLIEENAWLDFDDAEMIDFDNEVILVQ